MRKAKIIAIVGATASGKTSLSIDLAKRFNGEVISADSRQIYQKLDIGTGKITEDEMDGVPHHLIDIVDIDTVYTAADFKKDAETAITEILQKDSLPIIAGGTFFYLDLLRGKMKPAPVAPNPQLRYELEKLSTELLFKELEKKDPERAAGIDAKNRRRLIRSLEIIEALGKVPPIVPVDSPYEWLIIGVERDKKQLLENFETRAFNWLQDGFLEEVTSLQESGVSRSRFEELGFEYTLAIDLLNGKITEEEFYQQFKERNWQYAKRQLTWLKRDEQVEWFDTENKTALLKRVKEFLGT